MDQLRRIDSLDSISTRSSTGSPIDSEDSSARSFEFINLTTTGPTAKDVGQRKVVRAHVVKDFSRKRKLQRLQAEKLKGRKIQPSIPLRSSVESSKSLIRSVPTILPSSHCVDAQQASALPRENDQPTFKEEESYNPFEDPTPILDPHPDLFDHAFSISGLGGTSFQLFDPDPQISAVVQHVHNMGTAMFPLSTMYKFNPVCCNGPIGWDLDDRAAYHGIMYVTSTYANLLSGRTESNDALMHMGKVVTMVNSRLREIGSLGGGENVTEGLIGAVASIALAEALRGNQDGWRIHMSGVKHLMQLKGDISVLSIDLRHKLYRADLMGSTTFLSPPSFSILDAPIWQLPAVATAIDTSTITNSPGALLYALSVCHDLITSLLSLAELSTTLSEILSTPNACSQEQRIYVLDQTYAIQYYLLRSLSDAAAVDSSPVEECFKIAGLLFTHVTWQDFPLSVMGMTRLLERLRLLVARTEFDGDAEEHLLIWLLFIGAIAARKGDVRIWFVANIQRTLSTLQLDNWDAIKANLSCLWWVEKIHEKLCKAVYDEVVVLNGVLVGYPEECALDL